MFWYHKHIINVLVVAMVIATTLLSCSNPSSSKIENLSDTTKQVYFDIPTFVQHQIDSLKRINPTVEKTVYKGNQQETKSLNIKNWDNEFSSFKAIDLNKPAYAGFIEVERKDTVIQYNFTNPNLDLSCVRIILDKNGKVNLLTVEKQVKNTLYQTHEFLAYQTGEFYIVEKNQKVQIMGENYYKIQGNFQKK